MIRKGKLTPYASQIHRKLRDGSKALAIWKDLKRQKVSVTYEGVRKWIHANPIEGVCLGSPGRPQSAGTNRFDFLGGESPMYGLPSAPAYLLPFLAIYARPEDVRLEVTRRAFFQLGLRYDEDLHRTEWMLSAGKLKSLSDLEYCLIAYLVSDLPSPPLDGIDLHFESWFEKLTFGAKRLKSAASQGCDIRGRDLFE